MEKGRVLVIDDDEVFLSLMKDLLEMEGYDVTGLSEANDFAGLVREMQPSVILLDYCLTGRDGGELCKVLHSCPDLADIPVILLSAYPREHLPLDQLPFSVFIPKPFDLWELLACVAELVELSIFHAA